MRDNENTLEVLLQSEIKSKDISEGPVAFLDLLHQILVTTHSVTDIYPHDSKF